MWFRCNFPLAIKLTTLEWLIQRRLYCAGIMGKRTTVIGTKRRKRARGLQGDHLLTVWCAQESDGCSGWCRYQRFDVHAIHEEPANSRRDEQVLSCFLSAASILAENSEFFSNPRIGRCSNIFLPRWLTCTKTHARVHAKTVLLEQHRTAYCTPTSHTASHSYTASMHKVVRVFWGGRGKRGAGTVQVQ